MWRLNLAKTSIYIDGYNLYYSRLKGTQFKWLDIVALFRDRILLPQDPGAEVQIYRDAARGVCEQLVICSNDSDLEPVLRLIREDVPGATMGLVMPLRENSKDTGKVPNKRLTALAHWVRHHIRDDELARSQLPQNVTTKKKPASKPPHW